MAGAVEMRLVLMLLCLGLSALAAWPWAAPLLDRRPAANLPAPPSGSEVSDWSLPSLDGLAETRNRPLFTPSRRPPPARIEPQKLQAGVAASAREAFAGFRLKGVMIAGSKRQVLLTPPGGSRPLVLEEGSTHAGWTVQKIEPERLTLTAGEKVETIPLGRVSQ